MPHAAMGMKGTIIVNGTTNISDAGYSFRFEAFPNPANDFVNVKIQLANRSHITIELYDITGRIVSQLLSTELPSGEYQKQFDLDRGSIKAGRYFIKGSYEGKVFTEALIIR